MNAERQLRVELREVVVSRLLQEDGARERLATALGLPGSSIDRIIERPVWDLDFTLETADALDLVLHVTST